MGAKVGTGAQGWSVNAWVCFCVWPALTSRLTHPCWCEVAVAGATAQSVGGIDTPPCIQHVPRTAIYTGIYSVSLASGHFWVACELQAHLHVRSINMMCNYSVFCGDTVFLLQCIHLNVTIQDISEALSSFISKTGIYSLETKGKVSSACSTCRNVVKSRCWVFLLKWSSCLVVQVLCLLFISWVQLLCQVFVNSAPTENDSMKVLLRV